MVQLGQEQASTKTSASYMHLPWKLWPQHRENGRWLHLDIGPNWVEGRNIHGTTDVPLQGIQNFAWSNLQEFHPICERQMEGQREYWVDQSDLSGWWEVQVTMWGRNLEEQTLKQASNHCTSLPQWSKRLWGSALPWRLLILTRRSTNWSLALNIRKRKEKKVWSPVMLSGRQLFQKWRTAWENHDQQDLPLVPKSWKSWNMGCTQACRLHNERKEASCWEQVHQETNWPSKNNLWLE